MKISISRRQQKPPTLGQLDTPVMVFESRSVPDDFTGFDVTLEPLHHLWAKVSYGAGSVDKGGDVSSEVYPVHEVIVQAMGVNVSRGMVVIINREVLFVLEARPLDTRSDWMLMYVVQRSAMATADLTINREGQAPVSSEDDPAASDLWRAGF